MALQEAPPRRRRLPTADGVRYGSLPSRRRQRRGPRPVRRRPSCSLHRQRSPPAHSQAVRSSSRGLARGFARRRLARDARASSQPCCPQQLPSPGWRRRERQVAPWHHRSRSRSSPHVACSSCACRACGACACRACSASSHRRPAAAPQQEPPSSPRQSPAASSSLAAAPWRRRASSGRALLPPPSHAASAPRSPPSRRTLSRRAPTTCRAQPKREERETREGHSGRLDAHSHSLSLSTCPRVTCAHTLPVRRQNVPDAPTGPRTQSQTRNLATPQSGALVRRGLPAPPHLGRLRQGTSTMTGTRRAHTCPNRDRTQRVNEGIYRRRR